MTQEKLNSQNNQTNEPVDLAKLRQKFLEISALSPLQVLDTMSQRFEHTAKTIGEIHSEETKAA